MVAIVKHGFVFVVMCLFALTVAHAQPLQRIEVAPNVYALVGPMEQRSADNLANNANFGFVVGENSVILVDSGGTLRGAQAIEKQIRAVTDKPVSLVINTGGQDHRWFGNAYFTAQGAKTLTSVDTREDQVARGDVQVGKTSGYVGRSWQGTEPQVAQETVEEVTEITEEGVRLQLIPVGAAHTGGETLVWLPDQKLLFSGDVVYMDRMLGVGSQSQHLAWIEAFKVIQQLKPVHIVPGHGLPTDLAGAERDTYRYLLFLRQKVGELVETGEDMSAAAAIDQSQFSYLEVYEQIHKRNALRVFEEMEWE